MAEIWVAAIGVGLTAYGMISQKKSADQAAQVDTATSALNARFDIAQAQQLDLDTLANVRTMRQGAKEYLSKQDASYAAAGVLSTTGSPLHAQITNAGRLEQQIQQEYVNGLARQNELYSKAKAGILEGDARATSDRMMGTLALVNGGASIARTGFNAYQSGMFSSGKGTLPAGADLF